MALTGAAALSGHSGLPQTPSDYKTVVDECNRLRRHVQHLSDERLGPLASSSLGAANTRLPFALLLGNHSSGKSTFINYILGSDIQSSGIAPTDDCFTIIGHGPSDCDRSGSALIGDPDLGFQSLVTFGPMLVHKTVLKLRQDLPSAFRDMMIVDSPGMIDAVSERGRVDRGYDFNAVIRWYAERADVIVLFFDPDKPGTTVETLQVLTDALVGFDEKLLLVLNKCDKFKRVKDFSRTYGALCWNLAKIIPRKDLPQIYTMSVPHGDESSFDNLTLERQTFALNSSQDLEESRNQVIREILSAPKKRIDNEISLLAENVAMLIMHCKVTDVAIRDYRNRLRGSQINFAAMVSCSLLATALVALQYKNLKSLVIGIFPLNITVTQAAKVVSKQIRDASTNAVTTSVKPMVSSPPSEAVEHIIELVKSENFKATMVTALSSLTASASYLGIQYLRASNFVQDMFLTSYFNDVFSSLYPKHENDYVANLWQRTCSRLLRRWDPETVQAMEPMNPADLEELKRIQESEILSLRRRVAPAYYPFDRSHPSATSLSTGSLASMASGPLTSTVTVAPSNAPSANTTPHRQQQQQQGSSSSPAVSPLPLLDGGVSSPM